MKETISFKSAKPYFSKEADGKKPNTVRYLEKTDPRHKLLMKWVTTQSFGCIEILSVLDSTYFEGFTRDITDISLITHLMPPVPGQDCFIISWKHPEPLFDIKNPEKCLK